MFAQHISEAEYEKQKTDYTRQALDALIQSPEYQKKYKSCRRLGQLHCTTCTDKFRIGLTAVFLKFQKNINLFEKNSSLKFVLI